jgi:hypothetical protein
MKIGSIENILKYLSGIFTVFKRHEAVVGEVVEKRDLKNKRRAKKIELRNLKTDKKIERQKRKLDKKKNR